MYTDIIDYKLAEGVSEEDLLIAAKDIYETWMKDQPGFLGWQINKSDDGYLDLVCWESKEDAQKAETNMHENIDPSNAWFACYNPESISAENVSEVMSFGS